MLRQDQGLDCLFPNARSLDLGDGLQYLFFIVVPQVRLEGLQKVQISGSLACLAPK